MLLSRLAVASLSLVVACTRRDPPPARADSAPPPSAAPTQAGGSAPTEAAADDAALGVLLQGSATLTVQTVDAQCYDGDTVHKWRVGVDVFVELAEGGSSRTTKVFPFCPAAAADGGSRTPRLQLWENCSAFAACAAVAAEAGAQHVAEIRCGNETVRVELDGPRTILRGSFGVRELSPHGMRVPPVRRTTRIAHVDC